MLYWNGSYYAGGEKFCKNSVRHIKCIYSWREGFIWQDSYGCSMLSIMITALSACAADSSRGIGNARDVSGGISQYHVIERIDAQGVSTVRYFDNDSICISAYNKDRGAQIGFWELSLSKLNLRTDEMTVFYKDVRSTDFMRNISTYKLGDGNEAVFNGANIFYLTGGKLIDSIELDEAFRREANFNADKKVVTFVHQETQDLYCWTAHANEMSIIYPAVDPQTKDKRYPYYPLLHPAGDRVLFQTSKGEMAGADRLACYSLETGKLVFDTAIERKSDMVEYVWLSDNSFLIWEPSDDNGGCTYITVYNADGHVREQYVINKTIIQVQAGQSHQADCFAALIFDGFDEETQAVQNSIAIIDLSNKSAKQVYKSEKSVVSIDLSPSFEKIVWSENEAIYEMDLKNAQAISMNLSKLDSK